MRIAGGYTTQTSCGQVFEALFAPDLLARAMPNCERLIQLGPVAEDGAAAYEARVRLDDSPWIVTASIAGGPRSGGIGARLHFFGGGRRYSAHGILHLAGEGDGTAVSYRFDMDAGASDPQEARTEAAIQAAAEAFLERLARFAQDSATAAAVQRVEADMSEPLDADARGRTLGRAGQRAAWIGAGLVAGLAGVALLSSVARRLARRE